MENKILNQIQELKNELQVRGAALITKNTKKSHTRFESGEFLGFKLSIDDIGKEEIKPLYQELNSLIAEIVLKGVNVLLDEIDTAEEISIEEFSKCFDELQQIFGVTSTNLAAYALYLNKNGKLNLDMQGTEK